ncbi:caskin-1-like, partial [Pseudopipra pipra]|uniref:caskin-1-like n=1 Tax=Pseudopipra pipra TaxID=415032 RepID=UPI0031398EB4
PPKIPPVPPPHSPSPLCFSPQAPPWTPRTPQNPRIPPGSPLLTPPGPPGPPQIPALSHAHPARLRALQALVALSEALAEPESLDSALAEAGKALEEAEGVLGQLRGVLDAQLAAAAPATAPDEDPGLFRALAALAQAAADDTQRELDGIRLRRRLFQAGQGLVVALLVVISPIMSLDWARQALGVSPEGHLVPLLAALAALCEVALRSLAASRRHLAEARGHQRRLALRHRARADHIAAARAALEAARATGGHVAAALAGLGQVATHLRDLVAAVARDAGVARLLGTRPATFPESRRVLGDIAVALGTSGGDGEVEEVRRRLGEVAEGEG